MKRKPAKRATTRPKARTRDDAPAHGLRVAHVVEHVPAPHGVEHPTLPPDTFACEVAAMMGAYFGNASVHPEVRRLIVLATRLRQAWQGANCRCIERHPPERRAGSPERMASFAYQRAMARLIEAARELAALPVRH